MSISTRSIGMKGNNGALHAASKSCLTPLTQHCLFFDFFSCTVLEPLLASVSDRSIAVFALCDLGHLHHMHEYSALADSVPQMVC